MIFNISLFNWAWGIAGAVLLGVVFLALIIATVIFLTKGKKKE